MQICDWHDNARYLLEAFAERLLALQPASVLDVGCGDGDLLRRCADDGVPAAGVEPEPASLPALQSAGFDVARAPAEGLPFADRSHDWVTFRHVPHHLADPGAAFAEALRVCRRGVLLAEPWFDPSMASQCNARTADEWLKRQHRRSGMRHADALSARALLDALPAGADLDIEVASVLRLRRRTAADLTAEADPWLDALDPDHPDRAAFARLIDAIDANDLTWNGSLIVTARRAD